MTSIYTFHTFEKATIAAIEYVIRKYKHNSWFVGALSKTVNFVYYHKDSSQLFQSPLEISKDNNDTLHHRRGYHYVISEIKRYDQYFKTTNISVICLFLILFNLTYMIISLFLKNNNNG